MNRKYFLILLISTLTFNAQAQHAEVSPDSLGKADSVTNLKTFFTQGHFHGHVRSYSMKTVNYKGLSDHYAHAIGAELGYKTAAYKGFSMGLTGLFSFRTMSSDLETPDAIAGKLPRFEIELFDISDPANRTDLDRLDELYLQYKNRFTDVHAGRFSFNSPLLNAQDGRMKPNSVQGIHAAFAPRKDSKVHVALLNGVSPRGTVEWFSLEEGIGEYPTGFLPNGTNAPYRGKTETGYLLLGGLEKNFNKQLQVQLWNYYLQNVMNTAYGRSVWSSHPRWEVGVEALMQNRVGHGGNEEADMAYFSQSGSFLIGSRLRWKPGPLDLSLNYLRITDKGKYLFPREFGREQLFVTVPRSRVEGLAECRLADLKNQRCPHPRA